MHIDTYGRQWRFTPGHDTACMLQISDSLAQRGFDADRLLRGFPDITYAVLAAQGPLEPYLLKLGETWYMVMRYGDEGREYYSPGLNVNIIRAMLDLHRQECPAELLVYTKLMGERA